MTETRSSCPGDVESSSVSVLASMREAVQQAAKLLRSIGSGHRLMILCLLMDGDKTVTQICDAIGARQSVMSQHLSRLRVDGLVRAERQGNFVLYSLTDTPAKHIVAALHRHFCPEGPGARKNQTPCQQKSVWTV
jgi:DNA-binding transcriptional ArsR family regulator